MRLSTRPVVRNGRRRTRGAGKEPYPSQGAQGPDSQPDDDTGRIRRFATEDIGVREVPDLHLAAQSRAAAVAASTGGARHRIRTWNR